MSEQQREMNAKYNKKLEELKIEFNIKQAELNNASNSPLSVDQMEILDLAFNRANLNKPAWNTAIRKAVAINPDLSFLSKRSLPVSFLRELEIIDSDKQLYENFASNAKAKSIPGILVEINEYAQKLVDAKKKNSELVVGSPGYMDELKRDVDELWLKPNMLGSVKSQVRVALQETCDYCTGTVYSKARFFHKGLSQLVLDIGGNVSVDQLKSRMNRRQRGCLARFSRLIVVEYFRGERGCGVATGNFERVVEMVGCTEKAAFNCLCEENYLSDKRF